MKLRINGEITDVADSVNTVAGILDVLELQPGRVAVELNGSIVDPGSFTSTSVNEDDNIEVVAFVGGG